MGYCIADVQVDGAASSSPLPVSCVRPMSTHALPK